MAALMYSRFSETARKNKATIFFGDGETVDRTFRGPVSVHDATDGKNKMFRAPMARI